MYEPTILTAEQCRALTNLAAGDQIAVGGLANADQRGPVVAIADDMEYLVDEDGAIALHPASVTS